MGFRIYATLLVVLWATSDLHGTDLVKLFEYLGRDKNIMGQDGFREYMLDLSRFNIVRCMKDRDVTGASLYTCATRQMDGESRVQQDAVSLLLMEFHGLYDPSQEFILTDSTTQIINDRLDALKAYKKSLKEKVIHAF